MIAKVEEFAKAYTNGHVVPPLMVRIDPATGNFYIVEGHTRVRGAKLAISRGVALPPLLCLPFRGNDMDRLHCQLDSQSGLPLKPVGVARNYLKLLNMGATEAEIAERRNKTLAHVQGMLLLAGAATEVQRMVNNDEISATQAIEVIRQYGDGAADYLRGKLKEAKAAGKTKIKPSAVRDWTPPRTNTLAIYASVGSLLKELQLEELEGDPETLAGKTVTVDAPRLYQLIQAYKDAEAIKAKRASKNPAAHAPEGDQGAENAAEQVTPEV